MTNVHEPNENADDSDNLGQHVSKIIEPSFQWGLLRDLRGDRLVNVSDGGTLASIHDDSQRLSVNDTGALVSSSQCDIATQQNGHSQRTAYYAYLASQPWGQQPSPRTC